MSQRTEAEILREARRVLRRLAAPRQGLFAQASGVYGLARGPAAAAASRVTVPEDLVRAFAGNGWILPDGVGRFVIGPAGQALLARGSAGGFAAQHREMDTRLLEENGTARPVRVHVGESPLARLRHRGLVSPLQFAAGEKLRRDFTLAAMTPRMGVDWSRPVVSGGGGGETVSEIALAARQRLQKALAAAGSGLADLLFDVCCHLTTLEAAENRRGWGKRAGRAVLCIALDRLAGHYGLDVVANKARLRGWMMEEAAMEAAESP
jgi:hypothetical protein